MYKHIIVFHNMIYIYIYNVIVIKNNILDKQNNNYVK